MGSKGLTRSVLRTTAFGGVKGQSPLPFFHSRPPAALLRCNIIKSLDFFPVSHQ